MSATYSSISEMYTSLAGRDKPVSIFIRCMLFLSSYFPLWVIIIIVFHKDQPVVAWASLFLGVVGFLWMFIYFVGYMSRISPIQGKIETKQAKGGDVMGYVASYVVPFVTFPLGGWEQVASLAIFITVLGIIYIGSDDMLRINPTLSIFLRYRLYEVTMEHSKDSCALLTRRHVSSGDTVYFVDVGNGIFLEKKK